jgi:hypothetical protein
MPRITPSRTTRSRIDHSAWMAVIAALISGTTFAQCGGRWLTTAEDSRLESVVGGTFTQIGGAAFQNAAIWTGAWSSIGGGLNGAVRSGARLASGDIVVGGNFTTAGGVGVSRIARWNGTSWFPLGSGMDGEVRAVVALPNGDIVAGGSFTAAGGMSVGRIARWNGASWLPLGAGMSGTVTALAVMPNGDIIAGGGFTSAGGASANYIARWNGSTWSGLGSGMNSSVEALAVLANGDLVAGGSFGTAGGIATRLARWNGASWSSFVSVSGGAVASLAVLPNGDLVAGGSFTSLGTVSAKYVARFDGSRWYAMLGAPPDAASGLGYAVKSVAALPNGHVLADQERPPAGPGDFGERWIACWDGLSWLGAASISGAQPAGALLGAAVTVQSPAMNGQVLCSLRLPDGDIIVGGDFTTAGGIPARRIARWNGASWAALGTGIDGWVRALALLPNGDLVAGGNFTSAGGVPAQNIARWNGSSWAALGSGPGLSVNGEVHALAAFPSGYLAVGGDFTNVGSRIALWNGATWSNLGTGCNGTVRALAAVSEGELLAGGSFSTAGAAAAAGIARWNGSAWASVGGGLGAGAQVRAIATLPGGDIVIGGRVPGQGIVRRWNGASWTQLGSFAGEVRAVAPLPSGDIIVGGDFVAGGSGGIPGTDRIARLSGSTWSGIGSGTNGPVSTLAVLSDGGIFAGGTFSRAGGVVSANWSRWSENGVPSVARSPGAGSAETGASVTLSSTCASGYDFSGPVTFQWRRNGIAIAKGPGGASPGGGTVAGATGALTSTGLSTELTVTGIRPSDAGQYSVVFTNACGSVTSAPAAVTVANNCPADLSGDGTVGGADLGLLLGQWGPAAAGTAADLNADGSVNGEDLGLLLGQWGPC